MPLNENVNAKTIKMVHEMNRKLMCVCCNEMPRHNHCETFDNDIDWHEYKIPMAIGDTTTDKMKWTWSDNSAAKQQQPKRARDARGRMAFSVEFYISIAILVLFSCQFVSEQMATGDITTQQTKRARFDCCHWYWLLSSQKSEIVTVGFFSIVSQHFICLDCAPSCCSYPDQIHIQWMWLFVGDMLCESFAITILNCTASEANK